VAGDKAAAQKNMTWQGGSGEENVERQRKTSIKGHQQIYRKTRMMKKRNKNNGKKERRNIVRNGKRRYGGNALWSGRGEYGKAWRKIKRHGGESRRQRHQAKAK